MATGLDEGSYTCGSEPATVFEGCRWDEIARIDVSAEEEVTVRPASRLAAHTQRTATGGAFRF